MAIYKDLLFVAGGSKFLDIFDANTLNKKQNSILLEDRCSSLEVANNKLFIGGWGFLTIYSLPSL